MLSPNDDPQDDPQKDPQKKLSTTKIVLIGISVGAIIWLVLLGWLL